MKRIFKNPEVRLMRLSNGVIATSFTLQNDSKPTNPNFAPTRIDVTDMTKPMPNALEH